MRWSGSFFIAIGLIVLLGCGDPAATSSESAPAQTETPPSSSTSTTTVTTVIESDAAPLPDTEVHPPVLSCVDATTQLAPTVPPGWQQFVLQALPTGICGQPTFLMVSLVLPSGSDSPGTLVTILTSPAAGTALQAGQPVVINGVPGSLQQSTMADGQPANSINIVFNAVAIEAHGNADVETLTAIVAGMHLVDDTEWVNLVDAVAQA